jgi:hypothetical protein
MRAPRSSSSPGLAARLRDLRARLAAAEPAAIAGVALAALAVLLALGVALRGIAGPFPNGHFASSAAIGMAADNMWRWHTMLPMVGYVDHLQAAPSFYMHHPLALFWDVALLGKVFGFHDWVLRVPPLFYVTLTPLFLYRIGREVWGPLEGGLTALAYVALPITIVYANYHDLEQPYIFGVVVATWGYIRFVRTWRDRYAIASALGFFFALNHAWWGYLWGALFLPWIFLRGFVLPERLLGAVRSRPFGRYCAMMCAALGFAFLIELYVLRESNRVSDVISSFFVRKGDQTAPIEQVLTSRQYRIQLMFTGLGIWLGKIAVPVIAGRAAVKRRDAELLPLFLLLAAIVHYVSFRQGAAVHIFWPHTFAPYFALAIGALAATARDAGVWVAARWTTWDEGRARRWATIAGAVVVGVPVLCVLCDGLSLVRLSRETGGRFAEANLDSEIDKGVAMRWFLQRIPPGASVGFHASFPKFWELEWDARPHPVAASMPLPPAGPVPGGARVYVLDSRATPSGELRTLAARFHVHAVGPFWFVDRAEAAAPIDGYRLDEREPGWWERWSQGDVEPVRAVRADPWVTWEWRTAFGQTAAAPAGPPATDDQVRIAHNAALAAGSPSAAAALRAELTRRFNLPVHARYANGTELVGAVDERGAQRAITLYFVAGKFDQDAHYAVNARVTAPPRFPSTLPVDPQVLDLARSPAVATSFWRPGGIYAVRFVYRRRPGREVLSGSWVPGPPRTDGDTKPVEIARLR